MSQPPLSLRLAKECKGIGMQHLAVELAADLSGQPRQQAPPSGQHQPGELLVPRRAAKQLHVAPYLQHQGAEVRQQDIHLMIRRQGALELGQFRLFHTHAVKRGQCLAVLITTKILQPGIDDLAP